MSVLDVGSVLYILNGQIEPQNYKYMVCVLVRDNLFFCINTENRKMYECLAITKKNNPFLEYDSYLSCNRTFQFDSQQLKSAQLVGHLGYDDLVSLYNHIKDSVKTLPKKEKEQILLSIQGALEDYE